MSADALSPSWDPALELGHAFIGTTQASTALQRAHGHRDLRRLEPRDHRGDALAIRIRAVSQQGTVQRDELAGGLRAVTQEGLAVPGGGIHLQKQVRELHAADELVDGLAGADRLRLIGQCRDRRQVQHAVGPDLDLAASLRLGHGGDAGHKVGQQGLQELGRRRGHPEQFDLFVALHSPLRRRDEHLVPLPKAQGVSRHQPRDH